MLNEPQRVVHKPVQLVCSKPLSVVEPVESDIECSSDSEHVDINKMCWLGIDRRGS